MIFVQTATMRDVYKRQTVSGTNLINTITGTTSVSGTKTWRVPEGTELPESITVILNRNGSPVDSKKVTAADDWSYEFTNLPAYSDDGSTAYTYTVDEEPVEGYITTVSGTDPVSYTHLSLTVYPAAGLIDYYRGNKLVLINMAATVRDGIADLIIKRKIGEEMCIRDR